MVLLYFVSVFTVILFSLYYYSTRTFNYWKKRNVVGPEPVAFFGNLKETTFRRISAGMLFKQIYLNYPNEKIVGVYRMTTPALLIRDPEIIKHVMIKDFDLFVDRGIRISEEGLGYNLFHTDEESWRLLRKAFTPFFTSGKLKNMFYLMVEQAEKFVEYVNNVIDKQPEQNVFKMAEHFTIATIAACAFGIELDVHEQLQQLQEIDKQIFTMSFAVELDFLIPGILKKIGRSVFPKSLTRFFMNIVETVVAQRNGQPTDRKDFMDLILELRKAGSIQKKKNNADENEYELEITDNVIAAQAFVFYAGGYETSTTTLAFLFYQLALNPDIQDKLVAEINAVLEKHNGNVSYEAITEIKYLDQVLSETLRMYPPADLLQRCAKTDYKIPGTNVTLEKGQIVIVTNLGVHYDEKYYDKPEKFDPERFSVENSKNRHPCTYLAFGVGPRSCIGTRFGQNASRVAVIHFLKNFKVEPTENTSREIKYDPWRTVLNPLSGIYLKISPRK